MKYIIPYEEKINERLGIPEGNIESAEEVFDLIVEDFSRIKDKSVMGRTNIDDKAIRKLAKPYDLAEAEDFELEEGRSSIVNMESHLKIKGISPRIKDLRSKRK